MPRRAKVHYVSLKTSLVNLPISLYGPLLERGVVRIYLVDPKNNAHQPSSVRKDLQSTLHKLLQESRRAHPHMGPYRARLMLAGLGWRQRRRWPSSSREQTADWRLLATRRLERWGSRLCVVLDSTRGRRGYGHLYHYFHSSAHIYS